MPRQDTTDFLTAFAVGAVLGIGATLLLRPEPKSAKERLIRELRPHGKRLRRNYGDVRRAARDSADAGDEAAGDVITVGKELLGEFRGEVQRILSEAADDLKDLAEDRVRRAKRTARRAGRKLGM